eukprot:TRINITY_DN3151_c0_g1_i1.p1 TRINITY_DN3151_c0_g1~~TRINITY_DN3151_c0_g1_i1.p1  ORF type:complete len:252 (+),score=65.28 TRINITY_DN3151_c0_g1_i1:92-847(+)
MSAIRRSSVDCSSSSFLLSSGGSRRASVDYSNHVFSTRDKIEKYAQVFTGSHTLNTLYGSVLSKTLRFRHEKGYTTEKFNAHEIYPNLYVGDVYAAHNTSELRKKGITHIVNCVPGVKPAFTDDFKYLYIPMLDCATEAINEQFDASFDFIHDALSNHGRVLVHCIQGMSRSATIASSYVMKALHVPAHEAVTILQSKRSIVKPNYGFMVQLEMYGELISQQKQQITNQQSILHADNTQQQSTPTVRRASI